MSEQKKDTQGNETFYQKALKRLPKSADVYAFVGKLDKMMIPFYGIATAVVMYVIGQLYVSHMPNSAEQLVYQEAAFSGFVLISFAILALASFESLRRNELGDFVKMAIAISASYAATSLTDNWFVIVAVFGLGFSLVHQAARNGKLDWTPVVGYCAAYVGFASMAFSFGAATVVVPVLFAVLFEVAEVLRFRNYRAIRLALPGIAVSLIGIILTMNPTFWILAGGIISFGVVPTVLRVRQADSDWLKFSEQPCSGWQNQVKHFTINIESAMLTLVTSLVVTILVIVIA